MAGLQTIINNCGSISITDKPMKGKSISLSGHYKTVDRGLNLKKFTITPNDNLSYSAHRNDLLEVYNNIGTTNVTSVEFTTPSGGNQGSSEQSGYIQNYLGDIVTASGYPQNTILGSIWITSGVNGATQFEITMRNVPTLTIGQTYDIFKKGDLIQPNGRGTPSTVSYTVTEDVVYTKTSNPNTEPNIAVKVNKPITATADNDFGNTTYPLFGGTINVGSQASFNVKILKLPTYTIVPGDRIEFNGNFELIEDLN